MGVPRPSGCTALPDGKRYAANDEERSELLRRHASVSTSVLGEGMPCAVVIAYLNGYRGEREPPSVRRLGAIEVAAWGREWEAPDFADDLEGAVFAAASCVWRREGFDDVILDVAEDRTAPLLFIALETGRVYSPYDGGADLFVGRIGRSRGPMRPSRVGGLDGVSSGSPWARLLWHRLPA